MAQRYLTKSRFKIGIECPTKLFYHDNPDVYGNSKADDSFLAALAEGGFQVGELAKFEFPGGIEITSKCNDESWAQTQELLRETNVTIFEAAIKFGSCFVRIDILKKCGNSVDLIEVKSKSYDPNDKVEFVSKKKRESGLSDLASGWDSYILDVAFQNYVLKSAFPDFAIESFLMLANKVARATVDGLNQKFLIRKSIDGRTFVEPAKNLDRAALGESVLIQVPVSDAVNLIIEDKVVVLEVERLGVLTFSAARKLFEEIRTNTKRVESSVGKKCKDCEFQSDETTGLKSGFKECWKEATGRAISGNENFVFDIWKYRDADKNIQDGVYFFDQLTEDEFENIGDASELSEGSGCFLNDTMRRVFPLRG